MLEHRTEDLDSQKRKRLMERLMGELGQSGVDLYYAPTTQVATTLLDYANNTAALSAEERRLVAGLTQRDIGMILSMKAR